MVGFSLIISGEFQIAGTVSCMSPEDRGGGIIRAVDLSDEELYRKHSDELTRFATGLVGPSDAADVVSAAVLRAIQSKEWAGVENRRAYLYRSVMNEARATQRSTARRRRREERSAPSEASSGENLHPEIRALVDCLSLRQRAVILLTYWSDLDPAGIASLLQISEGSVRRHLARARHHLRERLNNDD